MLSVTMMSLHTCCTFLQGFTAQKTTTLTVGNVLNSLCSSLGRAVSQLLMLSSTENYLIKIMKRQWKVSTNQWKGISA